MKVCVCVCAFGLQSVAHSPFRSLPLQDILTCYCVGALHMDKQYLEEKLGLPKGLILLISRNLNMLQILSCQR